MKEKVGNLVATSLLEGSSLRKLVDDHPGYCLLNKRKIEDFEGLCKRIQLDKAKSKWLGGFRFENCLNPIHNHVAGWLENNIKKARAFKQSQLCVSAPKNMNKTSLVNMLEEYLRIYYVPTLEQFYDFYNDEDYDLIVFDEFTGNQHNLQWLNMFLQGSPVSIRKKGSQYLKVKNLPCLLLTNFPIEILYPDSYQRELFLARVEFLQMDDPFPLADLSIFTPITLPIPVPPPLPILPLTSPGQLLTQPIDIDSDDDIDWSQVPSPSLPRSPPRSQIRTEKFPFLFHIPSVDDE